MTGALIFVCHSDPRLGEDSLRMPFDAWRDEAALLAQDVLRLVPIKNIGTRSGCPSTRGAMKLRHLLRVNDFI